MYPLRYNNTVLARFYIEEIPVERHWYRWTLSGEQAELVTSRPGRAGSNAFTFTWDLERMMFSVIFSTCHLTYEQLHKDVRVALIAENGVKVFERRNDYFIESEDSSKRLLFIFDLSEWDLKKIYKNIHYCSFACFIPNFDDSVSAVQEKEPLPSLALDLTYLLESSKFSDVTIVTINDNGKCHEFSAHWNILASRSDVFLKMFETDMKEKTEGRIEIKEFKTEVMQQVLAYIYAGKIDVDAVSPVASDILRAADYYNLDPLRHMIGQILEEKLVRDNAFEYLVLSDDCKVPGLKKAAIKFITTTIDNMTENPRFKFISDSHMHLIKDLLSALTKK